VPVAVNCCVVPAAIEGFCGFTCMEVRLATTLKLVEPVSAPKAAAMGRIPQSRGAVACPLPLTVAIAGFEELHAGGGGQIVGCTVAIGSYSVELLRKSSCYRRTHRRDGNRLQSGLAHPPAECTVGLLDLLGTQRLV